MRFDGENTRRLQEVCSHFRPWMKRGESRRKKKVESGRFSSSKSPCNFLNVLKLSAKNIVFLTKRINRLILGKVSCRAATLTLLMCFLLSWTSIFGHRKRRCTWGQTGTERGAAAAAVRKFTFSFCSAFSYFFIWNKTRNYSRRWSSKRFVNLENLLVPTNRC